MVLDLVIAFLICWALYRVLGPLGDFIGSVFWPKRGVGIPYR